MIGEIFYQSRWIEKNRNNSWRALIDFDTIWLENETKIKIEKFDNQIKKEIKIEIKEDIKFETEVQRGLEILKKFEFPISQETPKNQKVKSDFWFGTRNNIQEILIQVVRMPGRPVTG